MHNRFSISRKISLAIAMIMIALFAFGASSQSYAQISGGGIPDDGDQYVPPIDTCNSQNGNFFQSWEFVSKVVSCVKVTITKAALDPSKGFLIQISKYMSWLVGVIITFAIIIFGIKILGGERGLKQKAIGFLIRLGLVWFFSYNLGGFGQYIFDTMDYLICLVALPDFSLQSYQANMIMPDILTSQGSTIHNSAGILNTHCYPWNFMDLFVGKMFGFGQHILLTNGLLGIVASALFSSTAGILVFFAGLMAFVDILFMIVRVIFMYLSCVLVVAFMIIISPFVIPMAVFKFQEGYFRKWLDMTIAAVLIPMVLFAFLGMFLGIYDILIDRVVNVLGGLDSLGRPHFDAYWRLNQPKFSWLMPYDPNLAQDYENISRSATTGSPAIQTWINPYAKRAMDSNLLSAPGVDFGESGIKIMQQLVLGFLSLFIFSSLMKSMVSKIPEVVQSLVGASIGIAYQPSSFESGVKNAVTKARDSAKNTVGNPFNRNAAPAGGKNKRRR